MLERINNIDYKFRVEDDETLLAFNIITSEMYFLRGNTKEFLIKLINGEKYKGKIDGKNIKFLKEKSLIIGD